MTVASTRHTYAGEGIPDFLALPDLASRLCGAGVVAANDELYGERENLLLARPAVFSPQTFGNRGQIMDGWETRRRREPGVDWAMVRLGLPGVVHGVVVDTAWFTGNYPPEVSVEGCALEGHPSPDELLRADWFALVPRSLAAGDTANLYAVACDLRVTHVRLSIYPDGGVARLRVHGDPVPDPRLLTAGAVDLAALANGATITGCSNMFYSSPANLIAPGVAASMGEGWETSRRRDDGNDWVELALAGPGAVELAELDTTYFVGNAPGWARLRGFDARLGRPSADGDGSGGAPWVELLPRTRLQPDTLHRFRLGGAAGAGLPEVTHVRLDIYPDGGMARLRLWGRLTPSGREQTALRWFNSLPSSHALEVLCPSGEPEPDVLSVVAARPLDHVHGIPVRLLQAMGVEDL